MILNRILASVLALFFSVVTAHAIELTNYDEDDKTITIIEGGEAAQAVIKAGSTVKDICIAGCVLQLGESDENQFEFKGNEIVSIEGNVVYDDSPESENSETDPDTTSGFGAEDTQQTDETQQQ